MTTTSSWPRYRFYGLAVDSELPLPEAGPPTTGGDADLRIHLGPVADDGIAGGRPLDEASQATRGDFWLSVPGVARYRARNGNEIVVDRAPGADDVSLRLFLLGSGLGAVLIQRGLLVLHGNAIRVGNECLVCVGDSGAGKSTLAAAFALAGHQVLADDVVAIDADGMALPGLPRIKLWQDAADRLGIDTTGLTRIRAHIDKYDWPLGAAYCSQRLPVRRIVCLTDPGDAQGTGQNEPLSEHEVVGCERFSVLYEHSYRNQLLEALGRSADHFALATHLSRQARITRLASGPKRSPGEIASLLLSATTT